MQNLDSIIHVSDEGLYPIRTVSEVSGVNAITLRAWERRYGLFNPKRTPKGHRLYSEKDIQRIHQVLALLAKGVSISRVAKALKEVRTLPDYPNLSSKTYKKLEFDNKEWKDYQETLYSRINSYDIVQLESLHHELLSRFSFETVSQNLICPVAKTLRNRAKQLPSLSGNYHFYKTYLSQRIGGLFLKSSMQNNGKRILLMSIDNKKCYVELLLFAMPLLSHNYQIIILGYDVSFDAIPMTLSASNAEGLLLFSNSERSDQLPSSAFQTVVSSLKTPVFIQAQYSKQQEQELHDSGLIILPNNSEKQIEIINKNINIMN